MTFRIKGLLIGICITFSFPLLACAQAASNLTLSLTPQYPAPYSSVTVTPESSTLDMTASTLLVTVNGAQTYQGNVQPFNVTLGAPGSPTVIKVVITSGGQPTLATLTLTNGDVALVLEPQATVPVLYPGKPLIPLSGSVRAVAVTDFRTASGKPIDPATLSYTWTFAGTVEQAASGIGKSSILVPVPLQYRENSLSVLVRTPSGSEIGGGSVNIVSSQPSVRLYENDPLLGVRFDHALSGTYPINSSEASLFGAPYSFSLQDGGPVLSWFLNGAAANIGNTITLRPQGSGQGNASLTFTAAKDATFENATQNMPISFGNSSDRSLFGL